MGVIGEVVEAGDILQHLNQVVHMVAGATIKMAIL